jgi:hypothetical protein
MPDEAGDDYERRYMQPGERLLYREKVVSRGAFRISLVFGVVFGVAGLATIAAAALGAIPGPVAIAGVASAAFAAFMVVAGAAFSVFRTMVTGGHLHVHFGWAKRKIPIEAIDEVKVVTLKGFKQGKVSMGLDGVVRTWVGNSQGGRGVEVHYREGARRHVLTIGSETPERFVEAIGSTRAGAATPVRVAAGAAGDAAAQAEAEAIAAEAEAVAGEAEARQATRR